MRVPPIGGKHGLQMRIPGHTQHGHQLTENVLLALINGLAVIGGHDECGGQTLHDGNFQQRFVRHHHLACVACQRPGAMHGTGGGDGTLAEAAN